LFLNKALDSVTSSIDDNRDNNDNANANLNVNINFYEHPNTETSNLNFDNVNFTNTITNVAHQTDQNNKIEFVFDKTSEMSTDKTSITKTNDDNKNIDKSTMSIHQGEINITKKHLDVTVEQAHRKKTNSSKPGFFIIILRYLNSFYKDNNDIHSLISNSI
jgi:hypothetical protein